MGAIELVEKTQMAERPQMKAGDTVKVHVKVREGDKERIQVFEGIIIGLHRGGARASFTVRKVSFGQGVERIFPLHSPIIQKVEVVRTAKVRRAKLYYLRDLKGKAARMREGGGELSEIEECDGDSCVSPHLQSNDQIAATRTLENVLRKLGFRRVCGVDEVGRGCLAGPVVAGAVVLHPDRHIPGLSDSKTVPAAEREELFEADQRARAGVGRRRSVSHRDRHHQHSPGVAAGDAPGGHVARAAARSGARRRLSHSGSADGAARRRARRSAVLGDRRGVDHGQGDARSADEDAARAGSALRVSAPQGLCDRRAPGGRQAVWLFRGARRSFSPPALPLEFDTID